MPENQPDTAPANKYLPFITVGLGVVLVMAMLPFLYMGIYSRFQADDYCSANLLRHNSFWQAQWISYTTWSNRYATMLATGLVDPLDKIGLKLLPAVLIAGLTGALYWLFTRVNHLLDLRLTKLVLFFFAGLSVFFSLYTSPNLYQSYYWRSGNITYTLPLTGLAALLAVLLSHTSKTRPAWHLVLIGLSGFLLAGFSETTAALLVAVLSLGLCAVLVLRYRFGRPQLNQAAWLAALIGALAGVAVILLAPGNAVRMKDMPEPPAFFEWLGLTFRYAYDYLVSAISSYILPRAVNFAFGFGLSLLVPWRKVKPSRVIVIFAAGTVVLFLLTAAMCAPTVYVQHAYPENRTLTGANLLLSMAVAGWGILAGILAQTIAKKLNGVWFSRFQLAVAAGLVLLAVYLLYSGYQMTGRMNEYHIRAVLWDERAGQIEQMRLSGEMNPHVTALDSLAGLQELAGDPDIWVNQCAAGYYGVESITAD